MLILGSNLEQLSMPLLIPVVHNNFFIKEFSYLSVPLNLDLLFFHKVPKHFILHASMGTHRKTLNAASVIERN